MKPPEMRRAAYTHAYASPSLGAAQHSVCVGGSVRAVTPVTVARPLAYHGSMHEARSCFEDAIDVPIWLAADRTTPLDRRIERDHAIADATRKPSFALGRPAERESSVRRWWAAMRQGPALGARLVAFRRAIAAVLVVAGFAAGCAVAAAALRYDGTFPVNVPTVLALLVGTQLALIAATLVVLPSGGRVLGAIQDVVGRFNPAAIAAAISQSLVALPEPVAALFRWHRGRSAASRFAKWQLLRWAQSAAVAFNVGAIATACALVAFTDLAFGWTSTLSLDANAVERFARAIAWPWAGLVPDAVPSRALIESSRFFRIEHTLVETRHGLAFTGWWPFVVMSIVCYALLPRLALWIAAGVGVRRATRALLLDDADVSALLDRLSRPSIALNATDAEPRHAALPRAALVAPPASDGAASAVIWADALPAAQAQTEAARLGATLSAAPLVAGGAMTLDDDARVCEALSHAKPRRVLVFVRAYEPPLWEFLDFAAALRAKLERDAPIVVVAVPEPGQPPSSADVDTWRRTVATRGDTHLYVEAGA